MLKKLLYILSLVVALWSLLAAVQSRLQPSGNACATPACQGSYY